MPRKDEIAVVVLAQFVAKEGKAEELVTALSSLIPMTRAEPGCMRYELNQGYEHPERVTFIEKFKDQAAFDFHVKTPYISSFFKDVAPGLVESQSVTFHREIHP